MTMSLIAFAILLALVFLRVPIAFAMALVGGAGFAALRGGDAAGAMIGNAVFETGMNYSLSVVPLNGHDVRWTRGAPPTAAGVTATPAATTPAAPAAARP